MKFQALVKESATRIARQLSEARKGLAAPFRPSLNPANSGFTLMELLIVIAIIGSLGTLVGLNFMRKYDQSRVDTTKVQIRQLGVMLDDYRRMCNHYPTSDEGLDALVHPPATCKNADPEGLIRDKRVPKDAWSNDFQYSSDGNKYIIKSLGADGKEGGEGFDKDISSDDAS